MTAPKEIVKLVERFDHNRDQYTSGNYNEAQLRQEFLNPFFSCLGWDVENRQGYAEPYKEVIHEDAIKIGSATKAPDYAFRIGGTRKFFVEAKNASVNVKEDILPSYQLRRYAWSAKLPLSILTDFEEFAVYDCRTKPLKTDKASTSRLRYVTYKEYITDWDSIASVFSKEAVLKGSFDKYAETIRGKKGTAEVDDAFLKEIESWRDLLAKNIALRNPKLSQRELNFAVQRTIDRIIFLRICEDRGIEQYGRMMALMNGERVYRRLHEQFQRADEKYNSGLFHFEPEKNRPEQPDELTPNLHIDDKPLKDIIGGLYYPDSPYEFSVLPADILGQVYEQFLGKVIRLTAGHQARVEEKPEVKKAGGVYYTPTYIVDYIVKNTVGKLLAPEPSPPSQGEGTEGVSKSKPPKPLTPKDASKLRILDPACGSGSFLIGAYQYLLDWHRDWYVNDGPEKHASGKSATIFRGPGGEWRLTTTERKRILLNSIYGVDIDSQAVEVTKLSLLLKVLEGENEQTISQQLKMFHERALPDLGSNIKCGNSLIGPDFYEGKQLSLLDDEEKNRINVFDWKKEFKEIMDTGGFDAVIGNPPYVDIKSLPTSDVEYIFRTYASANNRINLFAVFIERVGGLVKPARFQFSMIVPTALLTQESYRDLRRTVTQRYWITALTRLPNESFGAAAGDVKVDTVVFVFRDSKIEHLFTEVIGYSGYERVSTIDPSKAKIHSKMDQKAWGLSPDCVWSITASSDQGDILRKCEMTSKPLEDFVDFALGITPYDKYKGHTKEQIENQVFHSDHQKNKTFRKLLAGNDVSRYQVEWNANMWISYGPWLGAPREKRFFTNRRILVKQIIDWSSKRIWATITQEELYNTQNAFNLLAKTTLKLEYILGILNSKLMTFYHRKKFLDEFKMRFQKILIKDCRRFPIKPITFAHPADKSRHDKMVELVEEMLALHKKLPAAKTEQEKTVIQRQIDATDKQIDALVYELYGLTEAEIKIVEQEK